MWYLWTVFMLKWGEVAGWVWCGRGCGVLLHRWSVCGVLFHRWSTCLVWLSWFSVWYIAVISAVECFCMVG